jgi:hypothetical protein
MLSASTSRAVDVRHRGCYRARWLVPLVLLSLSAVGCATPAFDVRIHHAGAFDPAKDEAAEAAARALPWEAEYPVEVRLGQVPEGLALQGEVLTVVPGAEDKFQIMGQVESAHGTSAITSYAASSFWYYTMHDRHGRSRDTFCKAQLPLRLLTLGIWSLFSPTSWPCQIVYSTDEKENLGIHVQELRRAATALGANLVVGWVESETQMGGGYVGVQTYRVGAARVRGFAVLDRSRPPPR